MHGQFVWYELTTPDIDAARKFYTPITGWGTQQFDDNYTMWTSGGAPFAGIFRLSPEMRAQGIPPSWMPYIEATNIDETAKQATTLGGKVVHVPTDIPGTGRFAVLQDPYGAVFGIYRSSGPSQSWNGTPVPGRFDWHELMTTDTAKAFDFYRRLFGWEKTSEMDMGGGNTYLMYGKNRPYGGIFNRMPDMAGVPPFWLCYVNVKDLKKAIDTATKGGGKLQRRPMEVPGGTIAILADPQGAAFAVHEVIATPAARKPAAKKAAGGTSRSTSNAAKSAPKKKTAAKTKSAARKQSATKKSAGAKRRPAAKKRAAAKKSSRKTATKSRRGRR